MDFEFIYKICTKNEWIEAKAQGSFKGSKKDLEDGFIHFSDKNQVSGTLRRYYSNQENLILLKVNALKLENLIYEQASDGTMFPHLYSKLNISNVCNEYELTLDEKGIHKLPF